MDLLAIGSDYVLSRATKIDPGQVFVEGSDVNIIVGSQSVVNDTISKQLGYSVARLFLDGAEGDDLDRLAFDRYSLTRKGASPALGTILFSRASFAGGPGTIGLGTKLKTLTGVEYITTSTAIFAVGALTATATVRAVQAGKATQVGANAITAFSNPGLLFDRTIGVTNPLTTAGGEDTEDDDTFRARIRDFWNTARRGILAAIEFGALTVSGVVSARAIETLNSGALPARVVNLYISDSSGVASDALAQQVVSALNDFRAGGIAVIVANSLPFIVDVQLSLQFAAGVDTITLSTAIQAAIVEFINSLPVNGTLFIAQLFSVLQRFAQDGLIVAQSSIVAPTGDLVPAVGQTLRTTTANVTFA